MRAFDTYTHINELKKAGFNEEQAAVIIKSLVESRDTDISHLSTKEQVNALEHRISNIEKTMATKEQLDSSIAKLETTLLKWMVGTMMAFASIIIAAIKFL